MIKKYSPDLIFICTVIFLIGFGTLVMYSAGAFTAAMKFENYAHYLIKHIQWITIGTILYFICSRFKYKKHKIYDSMDSVINMDNNPFGFFTKSNEQAK